MKKIFINNKLFTTSDDMNVTTLKSKLSTCFGLHEEEFYILQNGRKINNSDLSNHNVHIILKVCGGKGGFGSMLRAIGAQIEKTTNREACRDLSGRRLRDINEEKRLKNWIAQQADREKEAADRKQKKLERLCEKPKHEFKDALYDKERSELPEKLEDAVDQGMKAGMSSNNNLKRKALTDNKKKKKAKLWIDADVEDDLSFTDDSDNEDNNGIATEINYKSSESSDSNSKLETRDTDVKNDMISIENINNSNNVDSNVATTGTNLNCTNDSKLETVDVVESIERC